MKKIKIGDPEWLQEIITKKEYEATEKRNLFFNNIKGIVKKIDFSNSCLELHFDSIRKMIGNQHFHFNFSEGEIVIL